MSRRKRNSAARREAPAVAEVLEPFDVADASEGDDAAIDVEAEAPMADAEAMEADAIAAAMEHEAAAARAGADAGADVPNPYAVLADYERRSFAHVVASADQVQAPGLWRGIAFRIGARRLMASITEVSEILPVLHHTSVPGTQPWLLGVVNVRGTLVPLVDLRGYIEGERTPLGDTSRMLVARHGSNAIGLLVEEVLGQRNLTAENDPLKLENDAVNWARFVPAHFELDGKLWGVFSMAALVSAPDFLHAAA